MKLLLKNVAVISPGSRHHMTSKDILVEDGKIKAIESANSIQQRDAEIFNESNAFVSMGWFDLHANFREPGNEYKEDLASGSKAALQGGFTGVLVMPSTTPSLSDRTHIEYILNRSKELPVELIPAGTLTANREGKDIAEMFDMYNGGVRVFTDDKRPITDAGLFIRALLYSKNFGGRIFSFSDEKSISAGGQMNEGVASTGLGLKGIPSLAEEVMIARDIFLAEYAGTSIHFSTISTSGSVRIIKEAKARGLKVTADVAAINLLLDDSSLESFDTNVKVNPPLRTRADIKALIQGLKDGTIDSICSDHSPEDIEHKKKEFALAAFGAEGIETAFGVARTATKTELSVAELISKFSIHPRLNAGLKAGLIETGQDADLTVFNPDLKWKVMDVHIKSKSKNNPFIGKELTGKPLMTICKGKWYRCL